MLKFQIDHDIVRRIDDTRVIQDASEDVEISFIFSEDWQDSEKEVYIDKGSKEYYRDILVNDKIGESDHLHLSEGLWSISLKGNLDGKILATDTYEFYIFSSGTEQTTLFL